MGAPLNFFFRKIGPLPKSGPNPKSFLFGGGLPWGPTDLRLSLGQILDTGARSCYGTHYGPIYFPSTERIFKNC